MYYHSLVILALECFGITNQTPSMQKTIDSRISSAQAIASLMQAHQSTWGTDWISAVHSPSIMAAQIMLLKDLNESTTSSAFVNLCHVQRAMMHRSLLCKGFFRLVHLASRRMAVALPDEVNATFKDFENQSWGPKDVEKIDVLCPVIVAGADRPGPGRKTVKLA